MTDVQPRPAAPADPAQPEITYRAAVPADRAGILAMLERAFGMPHDAARWDWIYGAGNPLSRDLLCWVAEAEGRIVGQHAGYSLRVSHAGREITGYISIESATDPAFQGRGISTILTRIAHEECARYGHAYFAGFPNEFSGRARYGREGWVEVRPFPVYVRPLGNVSPLVRERKPAVAAAAGWVDAVARVGLLPARAAVLRGRLAGARVLPLDRVGQWADTLWEELRPLLGTAQVRDARFLQWRYFDGPHVYRRYALDRGDGPCAFAALAVRPFKAGGYTADLMELLVRPDDRAGASALIGQAILDAHAKGAFALRAIVSPRHPHLAAFRNAGFVSLPQRFRGYGYSYGLKVLDERKAIPNQIVHGEDWYISGADLDFL